MVAVHALPRKALDQDVYSLACERVAETFERFDHVYVSFSGGKDSTAVLNVALEVVHSDPRFARHLPLRAVFSDEECIPYQTEEYVRRVAQRDDVTLEWYCLPVQHRNACSREHPYWWPWAPEARELWARPMPPEGITELEGFTVWPPDSRPSWPNTSAFIAPPWRGNTAALMGIRAQESPTRKRAVSLPGRERNWLAYVGGGLAGTASQGNTYGNYWKAYPIYDWVTEDVWTAPALKGWDYNHAYDLMEMAGVTAHGQRCSPAFGEEPMQKLYQYAECFPDVWERMVARVPGVGSAYRYARTELYGYGSRPEKPVGTTWPEYIAHYLTQHAAAAQGKIAARLKDIIARHYRQTSMPIAPKHPHPDTGVSWDFLLMIAMRGDFKERKQPKHKTRSDDEWQRTAWRRYSDDLAQTLQEGRWAELAYPQRPPADPYALIPARYREETS